MTATISPDNIYDGNLILVNKNFPYREKMSKSVFVPIDMQHKNILLERNASVLFTSIMKKIDAFSKIATVSGWRPLIEQEKIYADSLRENGEEFTKKFVALPNHSEHQTGLAIDVGIYQEIIDFICPQFPYSGISQQFRDNAPNFGFIQRYPNDKEEITGIGHEPWHFRYVSYPHSIIMKEKELTLEEYIDFLRQYQSGKEYYIHKRKSQNIYISYIKAGDENQIQFEIENNSSYLVSGNNVDGFIITEWRKKHE